MDNLQEHLARLNEANGQRIFLLDKLGIPEGWLVTTKVPDGFWEKCKVGAIPLKACKTLGIFKSEATREMEIWVTKYGKEIMVVVIPDEENLEGYSGGPILLADLNKNPQQLLDEALWHLGSNTTLFNMKRRCAMLLLGQSDTR